MRLSKLADYGVELMLRMSQNEGGKGTAVDLAKEAGLSRPTATKILKALAQAGLLTSSRGRRGGYALALSAEQISLLDIATAIDGPMALADCATSNDCPRFEGCRSRVGLVAVSQEIASVLKKSTLAVLGAAAAACPKAKASAGKACTERCGDECCGAGGECCGAGRKGCQK